jgi:uncharacterized protein YbjT (DUF2867 family)
VASADAAIPIVATRDVGRLAARCLAEPPARQRVIDALGPARSMRQVAEALARALGSPVRLVEIPPDAQVEALTQAGLGREVGQALAEMYATLSTGTVRPQGDLLVRGETTLEEVLAEALGGGR